MDKKQIKGWVRYLIFIVIIIAICGFAITAMSRQGIELRTLNNEIKEKEKEKDKINMENEKMVRLLEFVKSDEYVEQQARELLGWIHEDEVIFIDRSPEEKIENQTQNDELKNDNSN